MLLKKSAMAVAVVALGVTAGAVSASAQQSCVGYYNQVMGAYQTLGPSSPQYNQMANDYSARCLSGASAGPNPAYYQQPYGYYQPAPVDPAAAIVGAAIVGGVLSGAFDDDHRGYRDREYRDSGRRW
jgi:hypothetical protein